MTESTGAAAGPGVKVALGIAALVLLGLLGYGIVVYGGDCVRWAMAYFWPVVFLNIVLLAGFVVSGLVYIKRYYPAQPAVALIAANLVCYLVFTFITIVLVVGRDEITGMYFRDMVAGFFCLVAILALVAVFAVFVLHFEDEE